MKFYDYPSSYAAFKKSGLADRFGIRSPGDMYDYLNNLMEVGSPVADYHMRFDKEWSQAGKPYYNVYPSIIPMLTNLNLDFPGKAITHLEDDLPTDGLSKDDLTKGAFVSYDKINKMLDTARDGLKFANLLIRLPQTDHGLSYEDPVHGHTPVRVIFASFQPIKKTIGSDRITLGLVVGIDIGERDQDIPVHTLRAFPLDERTVEDSLKALPEPEYEGMQVPDELVITSIKLAITLCLLEDNPELIEPDVLAKDRTRFQETKDDELRNRLIDKARRRGKNAYLVGKIYEDSREVAPHTRRPHPCLVWTGKGKMIPKIILRKGSLIHRKKVEEVPTGYLDKQPEE